MKHLFGHDLLKAYTALTPARRVVVADEERVLKAASEIYAEKKGFEYFDPEDAVTAFRRYPPLNDLDAIARKLVGYDV